ncbi:GLPGLI family protein [Flavobacterium psychraquaticum]|uniref:GLPGLI family protein n=1 Tax=Flavobacterium psychraquaticum TaxID=3103958 RepID=UPI002ACE7DA4|nr:GLPGLI family protein [Flavobacterium sp. LB-N7T]
MKKTIILLLISLTCYSQSGLVKYETISKKYLENNKNAENASKDVTDLLKLIENTSLEVTLNFNSQTSHFFIDDKRNNSEIKTTETISRLLMEFNITYTFLKDSSVYQLIDNVLVHNKIKLNWKIENESKKIDDYICYKATLVEKYKNRMNEEKQKTVVAWFCPEIPYSFGPNEYYGLPGLILELEKDENKYVATKITLSKETIAIELPKKKVISKEEYSKKLKANSQF